MSFITDLFSPGSTKPSGNTSSQPIDANGLINPSLIAGLQTQSNKQTASNNTALNRFNVNSPFGSITWNRVPGSGSSATSTPSRISTQTPSPFQTNPITPSLTPSTPGITDGTGSYQTGVGGSSLPPSSFFASAGLGNPSGPTQEGGNLGGTYSPDLGWVGNLPPGTPSTGASNDASGGYNLTPSSGISLYGDQNLYATGGTPSDGNGGFFQNAGDALYNRYLGPGSTIGSILNPNSPNSSTIGAAGNIIGNLLGGSVGGQIGEAAGQGISGALSPELNRNMDPNAGVTGAGNAGAQIVDYLHNLIYGNNADPNRTDASAVPEPGVTPSDYQPTIDGDFGGYDNPPPDDGIDASQITSGILPGAFAGPNLGKSPSLEAAVANYLRQNPGATQTESQQTAANQSAVDRAVQANPEYLAYYQRTGQYPQVVTTGGANYSGFAPGQRTTGELEIGCPSLEMYIDDIQVGDIGLDSKLYAMDKNKMIQVRSAEVMEQPTWWVEAGPVRARVSDSAPILTTGGYVNPPDLKIGMRLITRVNGTIGFDLVTKTEKAPPVRVMKIDLGNSVYFTGSTPNAQLAHHNVKRLG